MSVGGRSACQLSATDAVALQFKTPQTERVSEFQFGGDFVWHPPAELIAQSNLQRFIDKNQLGTYDMLMQRSITDIAWFWDTVLSDLDIQFSKPYSQIVDLSGGKPWPKWCVGGEMNIVHNMVDKYAGTEIDNRLAIKSEIEDGTTRALTYKELREEVNKMAAALRSLGLGKGDAVGVFMPMVPEIVVAMLAIIKIGGIFLPLFSGFGAAAIVSRLKDADAKALFTADGTYRRGKFCAMIAIADEAAGQVPTLRHLIVLEATARSTPHPSLSPSQGERMKAKGFVTHSWRELIDKMDSRRDASTERTSAEDPMMIIYTSGTTGKPKGAVHTHCGFPIKSAQDMWMGLDLHPDETLFWMTDMGWMMGPWEVFGTLILGATMMLFDGAPDFPGPDRTWQLVDRHKVTALGVSPTLIRALRRHGDWAAVDDDGLWYILGRSDDTIKIAGKRLGPAEVESILVAHPQVSEAAAVGIPDSIKGEALVCFCVLKKGANGDVDLTTELKKKVATELGKALAPKEILFVADIPKTRNAKVMRRVVRAAYIGEKLGDTSALENPGALEEIKRVAATT